MLGTFIRHFKLKTVVSIFKTGCVTAFPANAYFLRKPGKQGVNETSFTTDLSEQVNFLLVRDDHHPRISKLSIMKAVKAADCYSHLVVRFYPSSIFDSVMKYQKSNFREIGNFKLNSLCLRNYEFGEMKLSSSVPRFNFERNGVFLRHLDGMIVMHNIPIMEHRKNCSPGKSPEGKLAR